MCHPAFKSLLRSFKWLWGVFGLILLLNTRGRLSSFNHWHCRWEINYNFGLNCVSLWLIHENLSSWVSAMICSSVDVKCAADEGQTGSSIYRLQALMERASVAQRAVSHSTPPENLQSKHTKTSVHWWKHLHCREEISVIFTRPPLLPLARAITGKMALVIVAEWQFILWKWIKTAWSCQSKAETQNGNCRHIGLFSARREFLLLLYVLLKYSPFNIIESCVFNAAARRNPIRINPTFLYKQISAKAINYSMCEVKCTAHGWNHSRPVAKNFLVLCENAIFSPYLHPHPKNMHIKLSGGSKLPGGACVSVLAPYWVLKSAFWQTCSWSSRHQRMVVLHGFKVGVWIGFGSWA